MKSFIKFSFAAVIFGLLLPLLLYCQYGHFKHTSQYAQPNLPYGPKDQEPWYQSRRFEGTDFQEEQSLFELQRQETESLRQLVVPMEQESKIKKQEQNELEPVSRIGLYP